MTISLNVLKHLGISLYSNMPAVLSEAVANSWDADATNVELTIDNKNDIITIKDDGVGLDVKEANDKFLRIGYDRRKTGGGETAGGRAVMGRKGIGKLSLFSIAKVVRVYSVKGGTSHGFEMNFDAITNILENKNDSESEPYNPLPIDADPDLKKGTMIVLTNLRKSAYVASIKKKLARRFSIIDDDFAVSVNGEQITVDDRNFSGKLQYLWVLGDRGRAVFQKAKNLKINKINPQVVIEGVEERIDGWIGSVERPGHLMEDNENLNKIVVMVRGKVAKENILDEYEEGGIYSSYLVGEIHADFLDKDDEEDIATTNRQNIMETDPRYTALKETISKNLKTIKNAWSELRNADGEKKAFKIPEVEQWFNGLDGGDKNIATRLFGRINTIKIDDESEYTYKQLLISGILTFESLKLRNLLDKLDDLDIENMNDIRNVFLQLQDLEAVNYYLTVKRRLEVIDKLMEGVNQNQRERVLQEHLFENLWLVDPSWEAATKSELMETRVNDAFDKIDKKLPKEQALARLDLKYRTTVGRHVIIELKHPDAVVRSYDLLEQIDKYRKAVKNILKNTRQSHMPVEFVCILGKPLANWKTDPDKEEIDRKDFESRSTQIRMYDELIVNAQKAYSEFIEKGESAKRIYDLIMQISDSDVKQLLPDPAHKNDGTEDPSK
ncbi:MAG: ATP-binding protein [Alphaproteobacteria bacterium]|nr:ATP-binding protein [Alphaproteobacteria bacterium]